MQTIKSIYLRFDKLKAETHKAILIELHGRSHWLPKSLCRKLTVNKKLGGNVRIPAFLYERMGYEPTMEVADVSVETHVPEKLAATAPSVDGELLR